MNTKPSGSNELVLAAPLAPAPLQPEVQWNLRNRLPGLVFAVAIAGVGGFVGGLVTSYGPRYLNVHVTEAFDGGKMEQASPVVIVKVAPVAVAAEPVPTKKMAKPQEELPSGAEARLLMHGNGKSYVVLDAAPNSSWGTGPKRVRRNEFSYTMTQGVPEDVVATELLAWRGRELSLYGPLGYACSATVGDFSLLQNSFEDGDSAASVLREFVDGTFQLVAELESLRGRCKPAVWARDASLPAPALGIKGPTAKSLRREALRAYRQTPRWKELQRKFAKEGAEGKWDRMFGIGPTVVSMRGASEEVILVSADKSRCGEFDGAQSLLFRVESDGSLHKLDGSEVFVVNFKASADFDGDGDLDFVGLGAHSETLLVKRVPALVVESESNVLVNVCGC